MKNSVSGSAAIVVNTSTDKLWEALTNPDIIRQYLYGANTITDWKEGSPIVFEGEWQGKSYRDKGTILEIRPKKILKYSYWSSLGKMDDNPENYMVVTYTLTEDENNYTMLTVQQDNIPSEEAKKHSVENWQIVLGNLKRLLEKEPV
ncbi:MAG: SRPBCC family protein [Bacteroidota bacterium]